MSRVVLFVCTGNICRSPMAQALFNARAKQHGEDDDFLARSAGVWAVTHQPATAEAIAVMGERGIDLTAHRASDVSREGLMQSDVILAMTRSHREALIAQYPDCQTKIHLMSELKNLEYDIADPYSTGQTADYQSCASELEDLIENGYEKIKEWSNHHR